MVKVAVILSGCGYLDGSEIQESVITLLELDKRGASVQCFAPDIAQAEVVNHLTTKKIKGEYRNVLVESARIARGNVKPLNQAKADDFDALVLPGGYGVAKNLSDLAAKGTNLTILPELKKLITDFLTAGKKIGVICISPALLIAAIKDYTLATVTIGQDPDNIIKNLGGVHKNCATDNYCADEQNNIFSCSAYMQETSIKNVAAGIAKVIEKVTS
jgi:enhancing lycopene biosynthesis protein 2